MREGAALSHRTKVLEMTFLASVNAIKGSAGAAEHCHSKHSQKNKGIAASIHRRGGQVLWEFGLRGGHNGGDDGGSHGSGQLL